MNPSFALSLAVSNVICAVVFGHRFSTKDETFHQLLEAMDPIFKIGGSATQVVSTVVARFTIAPHCDETSLQ